MGKNKKNITLRVRYKEGFNVRSRLVVGDRKRAAKTSRGRILRVEKVSENERLHIGEFNDMPSRLMKEFESGNRSNGNGNGKKSIDDLLAAAATENSKVK